MSDSREEELRDVLIDSYKALTAEGVDALVVGGIAVTYHLEGEAKFDHDIDLFIREDDVDRAANAFDIAGFEVTRTHPTWLFKARRNGSTIDVLYRLGRILKLDDEMLNRAVDVAIDGTPMRFISREDLAVGQAGAAKPEVPGHWFEAIDLLRGAEIDWDYVVHRSAVASDLRTALLHYAKHARIDVPDDVLAEAR